MVRFRDVAWALAARRPAGRARPASADPITLTGNVASDFTDANGSIVGRRSASRHRPSIAGPDRAAPAQRAGRRRRHQEHLAQLQRDHRHDVRRHPGLSERRRQAGDLRRRLGQPRSRARRDSQPPKRRPADKSIAVAFAPVAHERRRQGRGRHAGDRRRHPADKSTAGTGTIDGFTVAQYNAQRLGAPVQLRHSRSPRRATWPSTRRRPIPT